MAFKSLKKNFLKIFFKTLINLKPTFVNCKSVMVVKKSPLFLLQPTWTWLAVLTSNDILYDVYSTRYQKFKKKIFVCYIVIGSS